jgi:hypothetical protein
MEAKEVLISDGPSSRRSKRLSQEVPESDAATEASDDAVATGETDAKKLKVTGDALEVSRSFCL